MRGKIPKTELLVTFEVVAQYESFTRAAEILALTQSAVFRQVALLENFLHTSLFHRSKKRIFLNAAGKYYLTIIKETLNKLEHDTNTIMGWQPSAQVIELVVNPTFSTHWLIPNLHEFYGLNPDVIINIRSLMNISDFVNYEYDAAIMSEDFCPPCSNVEYLFEEEILPVCSARLLSSQGQNLAADEILNRFTLLHHSSGTNGWQEWFKLSDISSSQVNKGPRFDLLPVLIAAVYSDMGVALLPRFAIQSSLDSGEMIVPCNVPMHTGKGFIITWRKESLHLQAFRNWLQKKVM